jgi:hypothetical protein
MQRGHLRPALAFALAPARTYTVSPRPGVGADITLWTASASVGYATSLGPVDLALGGGVDVTHIDAIGVDVGAPVAGMPQSGAWPALTADATLEMPLVARSFLSVQIDGIAPLRRPTLVIEPFGDVHRPPVATARLGAGLGLRL